MQSEEIREKFVEFFKKKGHAVVPSSSLLSDDPSVLLTTAGMQQFKKYFTSELDFLHDFGSSRVVSVQKCFRTSDIEEVGDNTHLTFLEMLGNFSFGPVAEDDPKDPRNKGYFKRASIHWAFEFLINILGVDLKDFLVTVFEGDKEVPFDRESYNIWHKEIGLPKERIKLCGRQDNFWGPTGNEGPCGPTTELYIKGTEVWNLVFNEYYANKDKSLRKLENPGIDTGMGLERLVAVLQGTSDVYETDLLLGLMLKIKEIAPSLDERIQKIFADHTRASAFLIADGVRPSNKETGYVLRRLIRRLLAYKIKCDVHADFFSEILYLVKEKFAKYYPNLSDARTILDVIYDEQQKFELAINKGLRELEKLKTIESKDAFYLYETFGLPFDIIKELASKDSFKTTPREFSEEMKRHQEVSRKGQEKKFGGHGLILDTGELKARDKEELDKVLRLHTTTHLLQQALRDVLGNSVSQAGSDITAERTRFDFFFNRKMTSSEIKKVEDIINKKIKEDLPVGFIEMKKEEALKTGALHFFKHKYPDKVKVYYIGHSIDLAYSKEFCGGPHVERTGQIGEVKIIKEEAISSGVRRIRMGSAT